MPLLLSRITVAAAAAALVSGTLLAATPALAAACPDAHTQATDPEGVVSCSSDSAGGAAEPTTPTTPPPSGTDTQAPAPVAPTPDPAPAASAAPATPIAPAAPAVPGTEQTPDSPRMSSGSRVPADSSAAHPGSADGTDSGTTGTIGSGSETGAPVVEPFRESEPVGETAATEIEAGDELERGFATNERADEAETAAEAAMMAPTTGEVLAIVSASLAAAAAIVGVILLTLLWRQRKLDTAQAAGDHERYVLAR